MTDAQEKRLIEALRKVDGYGDVAQATQPNGRRLLLGK
jgi:hypothetical protein